MLSSLFTDHQPCQWGRLWRSVINKRTLRLSVTSLWSVRHDLGLSVLFVVGLLGHGGRLRHGFQAALSFLDVLLRVEDDDIGLGDVEHAQGHGGAQAHGHCQGGGLDEHLQEKQQDRKIYLETTG